MAGCETLYTLDFVRVSLPEGAERVLEIGCGDGALAASLAETGLAVVALDGDPDAVARARTRSVDARRAAWPDFDEGRFDAILFTRSLHHAGDLAASVAAAFATLNPGGRVIVEDFAYEEADEASLAWFRSFATLLRRTGALAGASDMADGLSSAEPPLAGWWHGHHGHDLHTARRMEEMLRAASGDLNVAGAAYYFRYLLAAASSPDAAEAMLAHELAAIEAGQVRPLSRRFVASA
jgi:SAM-dependent methyltransferase